MRAVVPTGHVGLDGLEYHADRPMPDTGPDEIPIRVGACGLDDADADTRAGWYCSAVTEGVTERGGAGGFAAAGTRAHASIHHLSAPNAAARAASPQPVPPRAGTAEPSVFHAFRVDPGIAAAVPRDIGRVELDGAEVTGNRKTHPASSSETHSSRKRMKSPSSRLGVATQCPQGESQGRSSAFGMCFASMALSSGGK